MVPVRLRAPATHTDRIRYLPAQNARPVGERVRGNPEHLPCAPPAGSGGVLRHKDTDRWLYRTRSFSHQGSAPLAAEQACDGTPIFHEFIGEA